MLESCEFFSHFLLAEGKDYVHQLTGSDYHLWLVKWFFPISQNPGVRRTLNIDFQFIFCVFLAVELRFNRIGFVSCQSGPDKVLKASIGKAWGTCSNTSNNKKKHLLSKVGGCNGGSSNVVSDFKQFDSTLLPATNSSQDKNFLKTLGGFMKAQISGSTVSNVLSVSDLEYWNTPVRRFDFPVFDPDRVVDINTYRVRYTRLRTPPTKGGTKTSGLC